MLRQSGYDPGMPVNHPGGLSRRSLIRGAIGAGAALALGRRLKAAEPDALVRRPIPSTGELLPVVGLGGANTFSQAAQGQDRTALREVLKTLTDLGGTVFDTAPGYGASEEVGGALAAELGVTDRLFWATKVNVAPRGGTADRAAAQGQIDMSFARARRRIIDLIQVHNLGDVPTQLGLLKDLKAAGRIRYLGVTTTFDAQYPELQRIMMDEPLDFIEVDYSIANRNVEETILPLAHDRGIGVIVALPFGRASLFPRVAGKPLPAWAADLDVTSWAQYFLKFLVGHPAVTVVIPGTSKAANMRDNMGAARGPVPDQAARSRMIDYFNSIAG